MSKRFFEKSKYIKELTEKETIDFLKKEKIISKVSPDRFHDFYNALSNVVLDEDIELSKDTDYDFFNCKTSDDLAKIDGLRHEEMNFLKGIDKKFLTDDKIMKAAAALSFKFEKEHYGGRDDVQEMDTNEYLTNLFRYSEDEEDDKPDTFGEMLDINIDFMKYLALLSNKKAFMKTAGKLVRDNGGKIVKYKPMDTFSDIYSMDLVESVLPGYQRKLISDDIYVRKRFVKQDRSQNLIILIDNSGSMRSKKEMVKAAITLKLRDFNSAHNIYIGTFITEAFGFKKIEKETKFDDLTFITLGGGSTDVDGVVLDTIRSIKERKLKKFPVEGGHYDLSDDHFEILVINDGEDHVSNFHPTIKIHALCLKQGNNELKSICHRSGGTYHHLK